jgi:hypothetical protein
MEHDALAPNETLVGTEGQINRWLREYMRGGPDRCEECLRLGALPEVVEKARDARRQWNADQYADAECAPIIDPASGGRGANRDQRVRCHRGHAGAWSGGSRGADGITAPRVPVPDRRYRSTSP